MARLDTLSRTLFLDALTCLFCGLLLTLGAGALAPLFSLPEALLFWSGASLFPIGAFMVLVGMTERLRIPGGWLVVAGNALWALGSLAVLLDLSPSTLGAVFVAGQGLAVIGLMIVEARLLLGARSPRTLASA